MKKSLIFLFLLGSVAGAHSMTQQITAEEILIKETRPPVGSLKAISDVDAWLLTDQIDITLQGCEETLTVWVTVTGQQGNVFNATITLQESAGLHIDTQDWAPGEYTITITHSDGQVLSGEFDIDV